MTHVPSITLNNGVRLPQLGLGTARMPDDETRAMVRTALQAGYRFVDTAASYDNETGVGQGLADGLRAGLDRADVIISTKLRGADQGYESAKRALHGSLARLGVDYVDLFLIHWPLPRLDKYTESWRAMTDLLADGWVKAIGVSNFLPEHLDRLAQVSDIVPAVNQIELHPRDPQTAQRADNAARGIITECWSPLANPGNGGGPLAGRPLLAEPVITDIADRHGKQSGQVVLRWHVELGLVTFPKSSHPDRLRQNLDVFDFSLTPEEMAAIATLADGSRVNGQHPNVWEEF